jgi:hypothetical protein
VIAAMVIEVAFKGNLAGKEHIAALVAVVVLYTISILRHRRRHRHRRPGSGRTGSGFPPIQS